MTDQARSGDLRQRWEERAGERGADQAGVLYQGLSEGLNAHVHRFHVRCLDQLLLPQVARGGRLLDLGCGYGRMADVIRHRRPDIGLVGNDFSMRFCRLFRRDLGAPTVCSDIAALPFSASSFDAIVAVTVLMYLPSDQRRPKVAEILRLLRPGGVALIIEPALELQRLMARLRPSAACRTTGGVGFDAGEFSRIATDNGMAIIGLAGMPAFTLALPVLLAMDRTPRLQRRALGLIEGADARLTPVARVSLHRAYVLRRATSC